MSWGTRGKGVVRSISRREDRFYKDRGEWYVCILDSRGLMVLISTLLGNISIRIRNIRWNLLSATSTVHVKSSIDSVNIQVFRYSGMRYFSRGWIKFSYSDPGPILPIKSLETDISDAQWRQWLIFYITTSYIHPYSIWRMNDVLYICRLVNLCYILDDWVLFILWSVCLVCVDKSLSHCSAFLSPDSWVKGKGWRGVKGEGRRKGMKGY